MTGAFGDILYAQKTSSDKKAKKLPCFKCKKLGHMNCTEPCLGPYHECSKTEGHQRHWRIDHPCSQRVARPTNILGVLAEAAYV
jgi:hypothetical protein